MRRVLLLLTVAAMILALAAGPVLAQRDKTDLPPPGTETPGNPQTPEENVSQPTPEVGKNCAGEGASNFLKGPGPSYSEVDTTGEPIGEPFPGSAAQPVEFGGQPNFNGPATSGFAQSEQDPDLVGNPLSQFQQTNREANAECREER